MKKLKDFLLNKSLEQRIEFASRCGTTWPFLRNVAYGYRVLGEKACVRVESESMGEVSRKDLRPDDWHEIWPELIQQQRSSNEPAHA